MHRQITKKVIESISTPDTRELLLRDTELKGFGIRISPSGTKTFFAEGFYKPKGVGKRLSLGRYPVISIDEARLKARKILYQLYSGIDPRLTDNKIAEETHQITLHQLLDKYCSARTLKSEGDYRRVTKRVFGDWFDKPVRSISREDVESRYRLLAIKKGRKAQTNKAMRYLNTILNFALTEEINGTPLLLKNPVKVLSDKRYDRSVKPKKSFIEAHKLAPWVDAVQRLCTPLARHLLLLQLQTGLRDSESKGLLWKDVDFDNRLFTVRNTKNGSDFTIPMSTQVYRFLLDRKHSACCETYVFPNKTRTGPVTSIRKQMDKVRTETGIQFSHHCLRRTFATLLNKSIQIDIPTIAVLLNHSPQGVTQKHYVSSQPTDFRDLYQRLSDFTLANPH
jgi:integrase